MKKKRMIVVGCIAGGCILLAILGFLLVKYIAPELVLTLNGSDEYVEVFADYTDKGANAYYGAPMTPHIPVDVIKEGNVDTKHPGEYVIEYKSQYKKFTASVRRKVVVVDTMAPVITCDLSELTLCYGQRYEAACSAYDNYDGDISGQIQQTLTDDALILSVTDSSGNEAKRVIPVKYKEDDEPPTITLIGEKDFFVDLSEGYIEPGFQAKDNCDGDITSKVKVTGLPVSGKTGVYTVTYTVSDAAGNQAEAVRTVMVFSKLPDSSREEAPTAPTVYLTFDDGPCGYTAELLDILKEYNVKATFFVTDQFSSYRHLIGRAHNEGHAIAIHTLTHDFSIYRSTAAYFEDLYAMQEIVKEQTGGYTDLVRFPGGSSNTVSARYCEGIMTTLTRMVEEQGYHYFDWNVASNDTGTTDPDVIYQNVTSGIAGKTHAVVLMHDLKPASIATIERIIQYARANGYRFDSLCATTPPVHHPVNN
ncbi:MAG: DUF5011 domain-containing protein [Clostridiales bacterium]|nr:DUF5011 domain-containing protein [Clostridiales bacterium]